MPHLSQQPLDESHKRLIDEQTSQPGLVYNSFDCAECGKWAATLALVPPGVPHVLDPQVHGDVSLEWGLWQTGFNTCWLRLEPDLVKRAQVALELRDGRELLSLSHDIAALFCRRCDSWYCSNHWGHRAIFDEGFYDYTLGTCPKGHVRKVDD